MNPKFKRCMFLFFGCGTMLVVGLNLATMFPNPDYGASWTKVIIGIFFTGFFMIKGQA